MQTVNLNRIICYCHHFSSPIHHYSLTASPASATAMEESWPTQESRRPSCEKLTLRFVIICSTFLMAINNILKLYLSWEPVNPSTSSWRVAELCHQLTKGHPGHQMRLNMMENITWRPTLLVKAWPRCPWHRRRNPESWSLSNRRRGGRCSDASPLLSQCFWLDAWCALPPTC